MRGRVMSLAVVAAILGGALLCQAAPGAGLPPRPEYGEAPFPEAFPQRLVRVLGLNEAQQEKIRLILEEERDKVLSMDEDGDELRQQLREAGQGAAFNEKAVRNVAAALAGVETEMLVSRARSRYRVNQVLTPAQRGMAEKLLQGRGERPAFPCGCDNGGGRGPGPADGHGWR